MPFESKIPMLNALQLPDTNSFVVVETVSVDGGRYEVGLGAGTFELLRALPFEFGELEVDSSQAATVRQTLITLVA